MPAVVGETLVLRLHDLGRRFGGLTALNGLSLDVPAGMLMGVLGPNGAGKTTLFNTITGVYPATSGRVWFDGRDITNWHPHEIARAGIGRTWQTGRPFENLTVLENAMLGCYFGTHFRSRSRHDARAAAEEALELVSLAPHARRLGRELNVFERKMLELARCLAANPRLLLLDEILAGLNPADLELSVAIIRRLHAEWKIAIIWIEHIVQVVMESAQRILVLHHGERLAEGAPADIAADAKVIDAYLGED
jgi:branched-chain amino acid transport system ATP-binding protein